MLTTHGQDAHATISPALQSALVCPDCRKSLNFGNGSIECPACAVEFAFEQGVPKLHPASRAKSLDQRVEAFRDPHREIRSNSLARALIPPNPICDPGERARHARVKELMATGLILNLGSKSAMWGSHVVNLDLVIPGRS